MVGEARGSRYALVTGGSSGIGLETARGLVPHFDAVGIVGRSAQRLEAAADELRGSGGRIEIFVADFSSLAAVRRMAGEVRVRFPSLGLLVNNAGVWHKERTLSDDGYEDTFAVNHLAHFLLTNELEDLLVAGAPSRVVNVSSSMHARPPGMNWDDLMFERGWRGFRVYNHSKLANVLFSNELARRWADLGVSSNALNPGNVRSRITRNNSFLNALNRSPVARWFLRTEAEGAEPTVYVGTAPELDGVTGHYFDRLRNKPPSKSSQNEDAARRLWAVSEQLVQDALG